MECSDLYNYNCRGVFAENTGKDEKKKELRLVGEVNIVVSNETKK